MSDSEPRSLYGDYRIFGDYQRNSEFFYVTWATSTIVALCCAARRAARA